jgi:hypothetical protein
MGILWVLNYNGKIIATKQKQAGQVDPTDVPPHFTRDFNSNEQKKLFESLANGGFLPKSTNPNHFYWVFGGTPLPSNEQPFEPLKWQKPHLQRLLAYFVYTLFSETDEKHFWDITAKCFIVNGKTPNVWEIPNVDTMKNDASKGDWGKNNCDKKKPRGYQKIEEIINKMTDKM